MTKPAGEPKVLETETIDRLFLELSQFTTATTAKEIALAQALAQAKAEGAQEERERVREKLVRGRKAIGYDGERMLHDRVYDGIIAWLDAPDASENEQ